MVHPRQGADDGRGHHRRSPTQSGVPVVGITLGTGYSLRARRSPSTSASGSAGPAPAWSSRSRSTTRSPPERCWRAGTSPAPGRSPPNGDVGADRRHPGEDRRSREGRCDGVPGPGSQLRRPGRPRHRPDLDQDLHARGRDRRHRIDPERLGRPRPASDTADGSTHGGRAPGRRWWRRCWSSTAISAGPAGTSRPGCSPWCAPTNWRSPNRAWRPQLGLRTSDAGGLPDALTAIEQEDFDASGDLLDDLAGIEWPDAVFGCAISIERTFLPAGVRGGPARRSRRRGRRSSRATRSGRRSGSWSAWTGPDSRHGVARLRIPTRGTAGRRRISSRAWPRPSRIR